jgi:hypothetical protein
MTIPQRRTLTYGLVAAHVAVGPLVAYFGSAASRWEAALDVGLLFGQVNLAAIWFAFSRKALATRLSASALAVAYVWCWLIFHTRSNRVIATGSAEDALLFALLMAGQWLVVVACLRRGRRRGDRLRADDPATAPVPERQYGLRQLFAWTAGVALLLAVARPLLIARGEAWNRFAWEFHWTIGELLLLISVAHALSGLAACVAVFGRKHGPVRAPAAIALVTLATALQAWLYQLLAGGDFRLPWWLVHNLADFALVALTLLALRLLGYRLARRTAAGESPGPPATGPASSVPG